MKTINLLLIISFVFICQNIFSQNITQQQWNQIRKEAYMEYINNGGVPDQYPEAYTQEYFKRKYTYNNSGQVQRKQSYVQGTFVGANGPIGSYKNGYVLNSMGQTLGYLQQGYFMNANQKCVGFVKGNQILSCNGSILATVNNNGVYNSQGYLLYSMKGETLYSQNYFLVQISGMDIYSLAAYLLFF